MKLPAYLLLAVAVTASAAGTAGCAGPAGEQAAQVLAVAAPSPSASSSAAAGRLVAGMPPVVPIPPGARITASALETQGELLAVSVTGTSRDRDTDLLAFFRDRLREASFTATDDSLLPSGAASAAFGRGGRELLVVAVVDRGSERSWSIGGTLAP